MSDEATPPAPTQRAPLLAVPNVSTAQPGEVEALAAAFQGGGVPLLDLHADADHNRSVFTIAGEPRALVEALLSGARCAVGLIDLRSHRGLHPHIGAFDVAPIVHRGEADRGSAYATALVLADRLGHELGLPVFLYGELAGGRTRAELRRGGAEALAKRVRDGELVPDFGPREVAPVSGATLVAARPPLVAFNLELAAPADAERARDVAAAIRESGRDGLVGVRAIGLWLAERAVAQVSTNIEWPEKAGPTEVLAAVRRYAEVSECELVGLAPRAAFASFPLSEVPVRNLRLIEDLLDQSAAAVDRSGGGR